MKGYILFSSLLKITFTLILVVCAFTGCYKDELSSGEPIIIDQEPTEIHDTEITGSINDELQGFDYLEINEELHDINRDIFKIHLERIPKNNVELKLLAEGKTVSFANFPTVPNDINRVILKTFPPKQEVNIDSGVPLNINLDSNLKLDAATDSFNEDTAGKLTYLSTNDNGILNQVGHFGSNDSRDNFYIVGKQLFYINSNNTINLSNSPILNYEFDESNANRKFGLFIYDQQAQIWMLQEELVNYADEIPIKDYGYFLFAEYSLGRIVEGNCTLGEDLVAYQDLEITNGNNTESSFKITANGRYIANVPIDDNATLVIPNDCGLIPQSISLSDLDSEGFDIEINPNNADQYFKAKFEIVDCSGETIDEPIINFNQLGVQQSFFFGEQEIDILLPICSDEFQLSSTNLETGVQAGTLLDWNTDIDDDIGVLTNCEDFDSGFNYIFLDGNKRVFDSFTCFYNNEKTFLVSYDDNIEIIFEGNQTGEIREDQVNVYINNEDFSPAEGYFIDCRDAEQGCGIDQFYVSHYDTGIGGTIRVTFSGEIWAQRTSNNEAAYMDIEGQIIVRK